MSVVFYRQDGAASPAATDPPAGTVVRVWRPETSLPPQGSRGLRNWVWWAFSRLGVFARRGFAEVSIWRDGRRVHRLILTPRWYRFPFMDARDLQIGDLWTHPLARRQGLARAAIAEAHRQAAGAPVWYAADAGNAASVGLIESCGYRLVGVGRRTRPFGVGVMGRFRLDRAGA